MPEEGAIVSMSPLKVRAVIQALGGLEIIKSTHIEALNFENGEVVSIVAIGVRYAVGSEVVALPVFTGLRDRKNFDIYSGDKLRLFNSRKPDKKYSDHIVVWREGSFGLQAPGGDVRSLRKAINEETSEWEIVGNIYEGKRRLDDDQ